MEIRPIRLPRDLSPLGGMICEAFQYPENPEWSVQTDEKEQISNAIRSLRRLWPLLFAAGIFSPSLRDMFKGYVAIEDGKIVGVTIIQRHGTTNTWIVGTVGVLPGYRRRGIARATLEKSLELMRRRGAEKTWLGVIDGNSPAQRLYESLGFAVYDSTIDYSLSDPSVPSIPPLPEGYAISPLPLSDWRTRFELEKRIAPEETRIYEPIEKGRFRHPSIVRAMIKIANRVQRVKEGYFVLRDSRTGEPVGRCSYSASLRGEGVNGISVRLDPNRPEPASHLIGAMLEKVVSNSPNLRIEIGVPRWMPAVAAAAESFGFKKRVEYLKMGLSL